MTRVNLVPVEELHYSHLIAEYREIPRVYSLARPCLDAPKEYQLGPGHVKFFYDKLLFIFVRHRLLVREMIHRGYTPAHLSTYDLLCQSLPQLRNMYYPTDQEISVSRDRLHTRLKEMGV